MTDQPTRRTVLVGAGAIGLTGVLAACGGGDDTSTASNSTSAEPAAPSSSVSPPAAGGGTELGPASEVPVNGGNVYKAEKIVVTQPVAGEYKAYSATCTHQGCLVNAVADNQIKCPCHFSMFDATDGSPKSGPAKQPLPAKTVEVRDGTIFLTS